MSEDDYYHGVDVGIDLYMDRAMSAEVWSRLWKQVAKEKRWRLVLCSEAATRRKDLLREAKDAIEHGFYSRNLIERIAKELGDD